MADVTIKYKGANIATMDESGTKTLTTSGKYCEGDVQVVYADPEKPTQSKTVTPTASGFTVSPDSGKVLSSVVVNGDADLIASNVRSGKNIFGVVGTLVEGIAPTGTKNISANGDYDVSSFATAHVDVASDTKIKKFTYTFASVPTAKTKVISGDSWLAANYNNAKLCGAYSAQTDAENPASGYNFEFGMKRAKKTGSTSYGIRIDLNSSGTFERNASNTGMNNTGASGGDFYVDSTGSVYVVASTSSHFRATTYTFIFWLDE